MHTQLGTVRHERVLNGEVAPVRKGAGAAGTPYGVTIAMSQGTVDALIESNYLLYGFKAVQVTQGGGAPLVWFSSQTFGLETEIEWTEEYQAYTSKSQIIPKGSIKVSNSYPAALGDKLTVTSPTGVGTVTTDGIMGAIVVKNASTPPTQMVCGISQMNPDGKTVPMCAFNLYGTGVDVFAPIEKVLLTFSTLPLNTGTVIYQAYSQSILIDLTVEQTVDVGYDINTGWDTYGAPWAKLIDADANIVPFLIQQSPSLTKRQLAGPQRG